MVDDELTARRRVNLRRIADELGGAAAVAKTQKSVQQISSMLNGTKSFGSKIARDIEPKLGLPLQSLDKEAPNFVVAAETPEATGYVRIQELSKIRLMECKEDWLYEQALSTSKPSTLKLFSAPSDNMEPDILQGGSVVVDISQNTFTANGIYAMTYQGSAFIYRIQMNPDGSVYFLSDNPKYEKMVVKDTSNIVIVGRCVGCCNTHSL